jgi:glycosyltransferase involved in cell wall biosynthesis
MSIVMPCLNEARTVGKCVSAALKALRRLEVSGEVIVADNGSTDGSQSIARQNGAGVIEVSSRGYGSALKAGIAAARGEFVVIGDADDSYDFCQIDAFLNRLRTGDEFVIGNRFQGGILPQAMPWHHRYIGNPILTGLLNLFFRSGIGDAHCGLRAFRKSSFDALRVTTSGMEFASEMIVKAVLQKRRISEVPATLRPDGRNHPSHLRSFRDGWRHLRLLLLMSPKWLYLIPSLFLLGFGGLLLAWLTPSPQRVAGVAFDVHLLLLGFLCVTLGYQMLWFWMFATLSASARGLVGKDDCFVRLFRRFSLEKGLLLGSAALLGGLSLSAALCIWWEEQLGTFQIQIAMRYALWGAMLMVLGVQTVVSSFFVAFLVMTESASETCL